jgi:hypothetical protein
MIRRYLPWAVPFYLVLFLVANSLVACVAVPPKSFDSPLPTATDSVAQEVPSVQPSPRATGAASADKGTIVGTVRNRIGDLPAEAKVFVAKFVWNDAKTVGVFYLDPGNVLSAPVEASGAFQVPDLDPGDYVLVVGVTPENAAPIMGNNDQARVIAVQAGQAVDLGTQTIDLP